jgi:SAM-dependent methyltransferase
LPLVTLVARISGFTPQTRHGYGFANVRDERGQVCVEWWESFFDEHYVQAWTAAGSFTDTDSVIDDVDALLGLQPGAEILDIACGFGRVAGPLSKRGYRVTGIDFSHRQLQLAKQRNPGPTYLEADMRRPPPGPFDAAINLFSSFGYFDDPRDDAAAVTAWATCLRPGGVLVMELMHRDRVAHLYGQPIEHPGGVSETGHTDWVTGMRTSTITYGSIVKTFRFRLYTVTELVQLLHQAGFGHVDAYGALRGGEVSPESRLALRAVK